MASRFMALVLTVALGALPGQGRAEDPPVPKYKRAVYVVKHGDAKELATALSKQFKDQAEIDALVDSPSNRLLISAAPKVVDEIVQTLEKLDRRLQTLTIEVLIADVPPVKGKDGKLTAKELDLKEFTGSTRKVLEKVEDLKKKGFVDGLKRVQFQTVENLQADVDIGELMPYATERITLAAGPAYTIIDRGVTGIGAKVTARIAPDNAIVVELNAKEARLTFPEDGVELFKDEKGSAVRAPELVNASVETKLTISADKAVAVQGVKTESKSGKAQTLIIVTARILEPGEKGSK